MKQDHMNGPDKMELGDYAGAIESFKKFIEHYPKSVVGYSGRASAKSKFGDHSGAIEDWTKAIELDCFAQTIDGPDQDYLLFYNRGREKSKCGDHSGAIEDFTSVIDMSPFHACALNNRAIAKHNLGDEKGAYTDWVKAGEYGYKGAAEMIKKFYNK